ncbi:Hypothetical predicted protein [Cloeon dipterum]|uniref:Uncharacterized protein n=1 Tax=Cloeon dipterum TaxID=197152 RepID=A0A8S1E346_9INSE|nr:Hypothetical predicted protein [Cloeon dipterum]
MTMYSITIFFGLLAYSSGAKPLDNIYYSTNASAINEYLKTAYQHIDLKGNGSNFVLFLGDLDGRPLVADNVINNIRYPSFEGYKETLLVDFPAFNANRGVVTDLEDALITKKIFEMAARVKIILVMPCSVKSNTKIFTNMVDRLINNFDINSLFGSVGVVCEISPLQINSENVMKMMRDLINLWGINNVNLCNIEKGKKSPNNDKIQLYSRTSEFMQHLRNQSSFTSFRRTGENRNAWSNEIQRESLRNFIFNHLNFSSQLSQNKNPILTNETLVYVLRNSNVFINESKLICVQSELIEHTVLRVSTNSSVHDLNSFIVEYKNMDQLEFKWRLAQWYPNLLQNLMFEIEKIDLVQKLTGEFSDLIEIYGLETVKKLIIQRLEMLLLNSLKDLAVSNNIFNVIKENIYNFFISIVALVF